MQALKFVQSVLTVIGVCANEPSASLTRKLLSTFVYFLITGMHTIDSVATTTYFVKNTSTDYTGGIFALMAATVLFCEIWTMISLHWFRFTIFKVFDTLKSIQEQNSDAEHFQMNSLANHFGKKISTFYIKYYVPGYSILVTSAAIYNYGYCYFYENLNTKCLLTPYKYVLPWTQDTVNGWIKTIIYSSCFSAVYFSVNAILVAAFVTICIQFRSMRLHYQLILSKLTDQLLGDSNSDLLVKRILIEAIHFHIKIKSLFKDLSNAFSGTLFVQMIGGVIFMSTSIFQADMAMRNPTIYITIGLNVLCISSANLYFYCFAGDIVTKDFAIYADTAFGSDWWKMANHLQKFFVLMIAETQRPLKFSGYHIININLETFTKMLRTVVSYYLMFRTLAVK